MKKRFCDMRLSCVMLLVPLLFAVAGQARAAEPPADAQPKSASGASAAPGKNLRKDARPAATKKPKQPTGGEHSKVSTVPAEAIKAPVAKAAADGKQNQAQDIPCFKTKLCE